MFLFFVFCVLPILLMCSCSCNVVHLNEFLLPTSGFLTPMDIKIRKQHIRLSTNVQKLGRLMYFYITKNKFGFIRSFAPTCCHLEWSQETDPNRNYFLLSQRSLSRLLPALDQTQLKLSKGSEITLVNISFMRWIIFMACDNSDNYR
jgi:hypothetical protein